jgi:adenylate cyclase
MDGQSIFGPFRLDLGRRELFREGDPVELHSRALDILCALAAAKGEVVGKDELMNRLWPGRIVGEGNLYVHISALRRTLDGEGHSYVVTVPSRGYRLAGLADSSRAASSASQGLPLPDKPSIAVMPFANLSGDPEQEYFADGMVEEITTLLSRIRWLLVIARNSSFTYKGQSVDVSRIGRELGARYVLEGSVRRAGHQLRITAQLIETETGAHLWADRFDGSLENVFELQDQIAISVAGIIEPKLRAVEIRRSSKRPTSDLTAYDLYLRALPSRAISLGRSMARDQLMVSIQLLRRAIEQDPEYGPALALLAHYYYCMDIQGWAEERTHNRRMATDLIRRALRAASDDPEVLATAAIVLGYFGEDLHTSVELIDQALTLNPSSVRGWQISGIIRNWIGRSDIALEHLQNASRLDPLNYSTRNLTVLGIALFFNRRFDEAASKFIEALEEQPNNTLNYRFLAASYAHMGRLDEARAVVARLRIITSAVLDNGARFRSPEYRDLYLSGLRLASGA